MAEEKQELKNMSENELQDRVESLRKDYFTLKLNTATAHIKDYSQFKKLRRDIAQALTFLNKTKNVTGDKG